MKIIKYFLHEESCKKRWRKAIFFALGSIFFFLLVENTVPPQYTSSYLLYYSNSSISELKEKLDDFKLKNKKTEDASEAIGGSNYRKQIEAITSVFEDSISDAIKIKR